MAWVKEGSLKGPTGAQGPPGPTDYGALDLRYLQLSGGALTGELVVQSSMYVEKVAGAGGHLEVQGNSTLQGNVTVLGGLTAESTLDVLGVATFEDSVTVLELISQGTIVAQSGISSNAGISVSAGNVTAPQVRASTAAPVAVNDLTRKDYVDAQVATRLTQALADTRYVNVTGGDAMDGLLTITSTTPWQILSLRHTNNPQLMFEHPDGTDYGYLMGQTTGMTLSSVAGTVSLSPSGSVAMILSSTQIQSNKHIMLTAGTPTNDAHATTKLYVDTADALRVLKAGDVMTGALILRDATAGIDAKQFGLKSLAGVFTIEALTDASALQKTPLSYNRSTNVFVLRDKVVIDSANALDQLRLTSAGSPGLQFWNTGESTYFGLVAASAAAIRMSAGSASGVVSLQTGNITRLSIGETLLTAYHPLALPADPASALHAATKQYVDAQRDSRQPLDTDLTTIAGLTATTDNVIQSVGSAWASRTPAQLKTSLAITKTDVGLANVDNTSDANKPVSTAQAAADALRVPYTGATAHLNMGLWNVTAASVIAGYGSFSGNLNVGDNIDADIVYLRNAPSDPMSATPKNYVDAQVATRLTQAAADTRYVTQTGSESISGFKTFTDDIEFYSDVIMHANFVMDKDVGYGDAILNGVNLFVQGGATIEAHGGVKSSLVPTLDTHLTNKLYVDGKVGTNPQIWEGTQAQFDALVSINPTWFYYVVP